MRLAKRKVEDGEHGNWGQGAGVDRWRLWVQERAGRMSRLDGAGGLARMQGHMDTEAGRDAVRSLQRQNCMGSAHQHQPRNSTCRSCCCRQGGC
jgi:hypothetical protein